MPATTLAPPIIGLNDTITKDHIMELIERLEMENQGHLEIVSALQPYIDKQNQLTSEAQECLNDFII